MNESSIDVPEEELEPLFGTIQPEQYEEQVQKIKNLYQQYE